MPKPQRLPRKYKACIEEVVIELRLVAEKTVAVRSALRTQDYTLHEIQSDLREIEALCLKAALDLTEVDIADDCHSCPVAPSTIKYQAALETIAKYLDGLAGYSRDASKD